MSGKVFFVGAGPGNPGMLTLRGAECLQQADVVLYDGLVNPAILAHAAHAQCECVGKHGQQRIWTQAEINQRLIQVAASNQRIVRLKGGDPVVFGRLAEECEALRLANIDFEIIPGITAALAAGGYAGIPITHRGYASAVALVTGHEEDGKDESMIDWPALAKFPGTLVVYMGVTTARQWTSALIEGGMSGATPAALVRRCSWSDQEIVSCRLDEVADRLTPATKMRPPVIVIVGPVVDLQPMMHWFGKRPLTGQRVLVTRAAEQAAELVDQLQAHGATTLLQPAIEVRWPNDPSTLDAVLQAENRYDWLTFSSVNGVSFFMERLFLLGRDCRWLANSKIACVGGTTAAKLEEYHLRADLVPEEFRAESLVESLAPQVSGKSVLVVRTNRGRPVLVEGLKQAGASVAEVIAYESFDVKSLNREVELALAGNQVDWVTVTSSGMMRSLANLLGQDALQRIKLASLSPITSATIREYGLEPTVEAKQYTLAGLVDAMVQRAENPRFVRSLP